MVLVMIKAAVREGITADVSVSFLYTHPSSPDGKHPELTAVARVQVIPAPRSAGNSLHLAPEVLPEAAELTPGRAARGQLRRRAAAHTAPPAPDLGNGHRRWHGGRRLRSGAGRGARLCHGTELRSPIHGRAHHSMQFVGAV